MSTVSRWGRCQLLEVGFVEIRLLVSRPPRTAGNAQRIAAGHVVFDEGFSRVLDIAASLMETPIWAFRVGLALSFHRALGTGLRA